MTEDPKPEGTGAEAPEAGSAPPRRGYIPRPPSQADLDRVSEAQGLITDEWAGEGTEGEEPRGDPKPRG
jgi:hypothetical protein